MSLHFPAQGRNYIWDASVRGGTQFSPFYVAMFEGDYTPQDDDTAANFPARTTECTAYTLATRPEYVEGAAVNGAVDNSASVTQFTITATKTITGFAILSAPAKGATTGVLLCIQKLASPRTYSAGDVVKVPAALILANTI